MRNCDLPAEQSSYQMRIGIERPLSEATRSFFIRGEGRLGLPRVTVGKFCETLETPVQYLPSQEVPLIYLRRGVIHFGSARWGSDEKSGSATVQQLDGRSVGYPALIPASFIDLAVRPKDVGAPSFTLRVRSKWDRNLFLGCAFRNDTFGDAKTALPLVCQAGPDIAHHVGWQPFLIPIAGAPRQQHFDFLMRRDHRRLQVPSEPGTIKTEIISLAAAA